MQDEQYQINVREKNFRDAVALLEGMGIPYAIVIPIEDGNLCKVGFPPLWFAKGSEDLLNTMDGCKACAERIKRELVK